MMKTLERTIISATEPHRFQDSFTEIYLKVWFEELSGPVLFVATPDDDERHGKVLWFRAMAGEFGPITVVPLDTPRPTIAPTYAMPTLPPVLPKLLEYHG